jgi:adenine deaminase
LRAATLDNAKALRLSRGLGSIEVGKGADLLLLKHNPLEDISVYDSIETIFVNGEPIARETLRALDQSSSIRHKYAGTRRSFFTAPGTDYRH